MLAWGREHDDESMGTEVWEQETWEHVDSSIWMRAWGLEQGDESMGIGPWGWVCEDGSNYLIQRRMGARAGGLE